LPSQLAVPFVGVGQGVQTLGPQLLRLTLDAQRPPQSCVPTAQKAVQASVAPIQVPAHSFWFAGQLPPQVVPSQVALPPEGATQAEQEFPQVCADMLSTQASPQG
jgi:hypothetical protein